jgi:hypothetical protein
MFNISRFPHRLRGLSVLLICMLAMSVWPAAPAAAAKINKTLDDRLPEFTRGTFQRTSLSSFKSTTSPSDVKGAVQLMPVSVIKNWTRLSFTLEKKLSGLGAASIGTTIFVLGGLATDGLSTPAPTAEVWSINIDPTTGAPTTTAWFNESLDLPSVQHNNGFPTATAPRSQMAVTAVETGPDSGYIYVIGGRVQPNTQQPISSYAVSIATVSGGHITSWTSSNITNLAGLRIPGDGQFQDGLQSASVVKHTIGSTTYVYLIGGLKRFFDGGIAEVGSKRVFYAKVGANGLLIKPSTASTVGWEELASIPIPTTAQDPQINPTVAGLWEATAIIGRFQNEGPARDVLYLTGGQYQSELGNSSTPNHYNNAIYRAFVASDGKLTWTSAAGANQWEGTLPTARIGMGGAEVNGKLYMTGGREIDSGTPKEPEAAVLTSIVEEDFTLLKEAGTSGSNFIYQGDALRSPISPRTSHGFVKIQVPVLDQDAVAPAYVYVIGGQGAASDPGSENGSNTLIFARIGGDEEVASVGFAATGWYYSTIHETNRNFTGEKVQQIDWTTTMTTASMDIELQYRISTDNDCENPVDLNNANWINVDGDEASAKRSKSGANGFLLGTPPPTHCFQYRAKLVNGTSGIQTSTPLLLNVSIQVIIPGSPDLKVQTLTATRNTKNQFTGLNVELINQYIDTSPKKEYPTQSADVDQKGGSFFVDLLVFKPGETVTAPTPPWTINPAGAKACATVSKSQMSVDARLLVQRWYALVDGSCEETPVNILTLFPDPGEYTVYVVVDSFDCFTTDTMLGCVEESSPLAETNNVKELKVTIDAAGVGNPDTYLPIILK